MPRDPVSWQAESGGPEGQPARESTPDSSLPMDFELEGEAWIARVAGKAAGGTGATGLGLVDAVHFFRAQAPDEPVREALLGRGRFPTLHEAELRALWAAAKPIVVPEGGLAAAPPRRRR